MKHCIHCKCEKSLDDYYKTSKTSDKIMNTCKECVLGREKKRREDFPERAREIDKKKYQKSRKKIIKWMVNYVKNNTFARIRKKAGNAARHKVISGSLIKKCCEQCEETKVHSHHDSYYPENWTNIRWLCIYHHKEWHKVNKAEMPSEEECLEILK